MESLYDPEREAIFLFDEPVPDAIDRLVALAAQLPLNDASTAVSNDEPNSIRGSLDELRIALGAILAADYLAFEDERRSDGWIIRYAITRRLPDMKGLEVNTVIRCAGKPGAIVYCSEIERAGNDCWILIDNHTDSEE